jgi:hypothetical protein
MARSILVGAKFSPLRCLFVYHVYILTVCGAGGASATTYQQTDIQCFGVLELISVIHLCDPPSVWRMAALPKIVEEIVSGVLVAFEFYHFMWALLMELKHLFAANISVIMRSITQVPH